MSWVKNFLDRVMSIQSNVLYDFPEERRRQGYGRAAKMIIDGSGGGIFELWFTEKGMQPKPKDVPVKNTVYMTEDTLLNLITPDLSSLEVRGVNSEVIKTGLEVLVDLVEERGIEAVIPQLFPRLDFRTAVANRLITVGGDKADVDSEEWAQIIDKFLLKISFPLVVRSMLREGRKK